MRAPSIRTRLIAARASAPAAILLAGLMVWQGTDAAFTAETHNSGNNWDAGSLTITDDDGGSAMFQVGDLVPADTGTKCITVTADSSVTGVIKMYVSSLTAGGLEDYITMVVQKGTGGDFASCTEFVADATEPVQSLDAFRLAHGSYTNGILEWDKGVGVESATYKFTWVFDVGALTEPERNALQGDSVGANFEWELQND